MSIFNFRQRQKMHTQIYGRTTGREIFKVDEYNNIKTKTTGLGIVVFMILSIFYFWGKYIPMKINVFLGVIALGCSVIFYYNIKHQTRVRESLYRE